MKEKRARVRYDKGDPEKKNTIAEAEGFYVETWDEEHGWCVVCKAPCVKSSNFTTDEEKNFIHWETLKTLCELSEQGYIIKFNPQANTVYPDKYTHHKRGEPIRRNSDQIEIEGHFGKWYVVDTEVHDGRKLFELEHETHGDSAAHIIVDSNGAVILEDVWNGFADYYESLE
jgi:hypothetical protein